MALLCGTSVRSSAISFILKSRALLPQISCAIRKLHRKVCKYWRKCLVIILCQMPLFLKREVAEDDENPGRIGIIRKMTRSENYWNCAVRSTSQHSYDDRLHSECQGNESKTHFVLWYIMHDKSLCENCLKKPHSRTKVQPTFAQVWWNSSQFSEMSSYPMKHRLSIMTRKQCVAQYKSPITKCAKEQDTFDGQTATQKYFREVPMKLREFWSKQTNQFTMPCLSSNCSEQAHSGAQASSVSWIEHISNL